MNLTQSSSRNVIESESDRRLQPRYAIGASFEMSVFVKSGTTTTRSLLAKMRDISESGIGLQVSEELTLGDLIILPIVPPDMKGRESLYRVVHVSRLTDGGWKVGAEIVCTDPDEQMFQLQLEIGRIRRAVMGAQC